MAIHTALSPNSHSSSSSSLRFGLRVGVDVYSTRGVGEQCPVPVELVVVAMLCNSVRHPDNLFKEEPSAGGEGLVA